MAKEISIPQKPESLPQNTNSNMLNLNILAPTMGAAFLGADLGGGWGALMGAIAGFLFSRWVENKQYK